MKKKTPRSFKENIRNVVTVYSIVPAFLITCICLLVLLIVWRHFTSSMVQTENAEKASILEKVLEDYSRELEAIASAAESQTEIDVKQMERTIYESMYRLTKETGYKADFVLMSPEDILVNTADSNYSFLIGKEYRDWGILYKMNANPDKTVVHVNTADEPTLCIGRVLDNTKEEKVYLIAVFRTDMFIRFLSDYTSQSIIADENGWIFLANNYNFRDNIGRYDSGNGKESGFVTYQDRWYYVSETELAKGQLRIYSISDTFARSGLVLGIAILVILVFTIILLVTHHSIDRISEVTSKDVAQIAKVFAKVQEGDLEKHLDIDSSIEFKTIADSYNLMVDSLKEQIEDNKEMAEHMAFAQVKQLESQFNPHFIFNTLDNIRFMMKIDEKAADRMIVALSKILRYSISNTGDLITVEEDLTYTESYLTIVKTRFNRRLSYDIDIDPAIMDCYIPKLLIQPLLENAIKYGFADKEHLHVLIKGYEHQDKLIFVCEDDGTGLDEALLEEIRENLNKDKNESVHLGLYNIHRRIKLLYKEQGDYGLRIYSEKGKGASVTLVLPVNR